MLKQLLDRFCRRKSANLKKDDFNKSFAEVDTMRRIYNEETTSVILGTLLNNHALGSSIAHQSRRSSSSDSSCGGSEDSW